MQMCMFLFLVEVQLQSSDLKENASGQCITLTAVSLVMGFKHI